MIISDDRELAELRAALAAANAERDEWKARAITGDDWRRQADADRDGLESENARLRDVLSTVRKYIDGEAIAGAVVVEQRTVPKPRNHPEDICDCGDYRKDHAGGIGGCIFTPDPDHDKNTDGHGGAGPCHRFKLSQRANQQIVGKS